MEDGRSKMEGRDPRSSLLLALDPSLKETGAAVLDRAERVVATLAIRTNPAHPEQQRLRVLQEGLTRLIEEFRPAEVAIELPYVGVNPATALKLGGVRGLILALANQKRLQVYEYTTFQVKQAITGSKAADKEQVRKMVEQLTGSRVTNHNISDAIAVGLCHLRHRRWRQAMERGA